jgi:SAM-dependent methyltransferase
VSSTPSWRADRPGFHADDYDLRWSKLAEAGHNPHGEVDRVLAYGPSSVLDAGCGTGRVAIELHRRGVEVVGVDIDGHMLDTARRKAPQLRWVEADLAAFELGLRVDLVVAAGNVMVFVPVEHRPAAVANLAGHLQPGGHLVAGFQLSWAGREIALHDYDGWCSEVGLELVERSSTWDGQPYDDGDYSVSVHRLR